MYRSLPEIADKNFISAELTQATKSIPMRPFAHTKTGNPTAVRLRNIPGIGIEMLNLFEKREWWEKAQIFHKKWFIALMSLITFGVFDLFRILFNKTSILLHWINDVFVIFVSLILIITLVLELIEDE